MRLIRGNVERVTESPQEQQLLIKEDTSRLMRKKRRKHRHRQRNWLNQPETAETESQRTRIVG